jgi:hypothetical protein
MTDAVMFNPDGKTFFLQLYLKKTSLLLEEVFVPLQVNMDMYEKSLKMFLNENKVEKKHVSCIRNYAV